MNLQITSLNLQGFTNWEQRKSPILDHLGATESDVVVFQEAVYLPTITTHNQAQILNQTLRYQYEISSITRLQASPDYSEYREGLASISRHPIISSDTIILKQAPGDEHNRILQLIDVCVGSVIVKIAHVHFSITDHVDFATAHLQETLDILKSRGETRIIIGDFNLTYLERSHKLWEDQYTSTTSTPYISYPSMNKRTDYALVPRDMTIKDVTLSGDNLSDHRALTITLDIPES